MAFGRGKGIYIVFFSPDEQKSYPLFDFRANILSRRCFFVFGLFFSLSGSLLIHCFFFFTHSYIPFQQTIKKAAVGKLELRNDKKKRFGITGVNEERKEGGH